MYQSSGRDDCEAPLGERGTASAGQQGGNPGDCSRTGEVAEAEQPLYSLLRAMRERLLVTSANCLHDATYIPEVDEKRTAQRPCGSHDERAPGPGMQSEIVVVLGQRHQPQSSGPSRSPRRTRWPARRRTTPSSTSRLPEERIAREPVPRDEHGTDGSEGDRHEQERDAVHAANASKSVVDLPARQGLSELLSRSFPRRVAPLRWGGRRSRRTARRRTAQRRCRRLRRGERLRRRREALRLRCRGADLDPLEALAHGITTGVRGLAAYKDGTNVVVRGDDTEGARRGRSDRATTRSAAPDLRLSGRPAKRACSRLSSSASRAMAAQSLSRFRSSARSSRQMYRTQSDGRSAGVREQPCSPRKAQPA